MSELFDKQQSNELAWREITSSQKGGFNFDNAIRNKLLLESKNKPITNTKLNDSSTNQNTFMSDNITSKIPAAWKTGTTICGITYNGGVVLGADTRATGGSEVVDKNCEKIHYLAPNIWCCGAGTAADTEKTTELIASNLELLRLSTGTQSRVITALTLLKRHLYKYQGHVSAACVLGGTDIHGPHMYCVHPAGSTQRLPYVTMGSGSLAAMAVFEARYTEDMNEAEAVKLVRDAIRAGIFNDLGSGSNVDVTVIKNDGSTTRHRTYENAAGSSSSYKALYEKPVKMTIPKNTTVVVKESFKPHKKTSTTSTSSSSSSAMEVA